MKTLKQIQEEILGEAKEWIPASMTNSQHDHDVAHRLGLKHSDGKPNSPYKKTHPKLHDSYMRGHADGSYLMKKMKKYGLAK